MSESTSKLLHVPRAAQYPRLPVLFTAILYLYLREFAVQGVALGVIWTLVAIWWVYSLNEMLDSAPIPDVDWERTFAVKPFDRDASVRLE